MRHLLAAGICPLVFIVGGLALAAVQARRRRQPLLVAASFTFGVGLCAMTPLLVLAAVAGRFDAAWIGGAGWVASLVWVALFCKRPSWAIRIRTRGFDRYDAAAVAIAVAFATFAFVHREPTLGYGRDQQVYAEYAISLSRYGNAAPKLHAFDAADLDLIRVVTQSRAMFFMPGVLPERPSPQAPIRSYLPLGWTVWLAFAHAVGGMPLLYGANALVMGFGAVLVFALARGFAGQAIALAASIAFVSSPLSFWVARLSLSEPLSLCLLLMLPLAPFAIRARRSLGPLSLVLFGACLVRVDAIVAAPALILALIPDVARTVPRQWQQARSAIAAIAIAVTAVCGMHAALDPSYFADVARFVRPVLAATWLLAAVAFLPRERLARVLAPVHARSTSVVVVIAIVALFAYAALLRPSIEPYSLIPFGGGLTGTRDFREDSLRNLAAYAGWPLLLLSLAGACVALRASLRRASSTPLRIFVALSLGFALLYLWFPHVSPDHPWAGRRFVPVILPAIPLFAALALRTVLSGHRRNGLRIGALILAVSSVPAWAVQRDALLRVRDDESIRDIDAIANRLPDALVVADAGFENIATALFVAYRKPVVVLHLNADVERRVVLQWIEAKARAGQPAWILEDPAASHAGAQAENVAHWTIERAAIERSNKAPARVVTNEVTPIALSRFDGIDAEQGVTHTMFGADRVWGVPESGFYRSEIAPYGAFRYTDGGAWMLIPARAWRNASALKVDLFSFDATRRQWVRLAINRRTIWTGSVAGGVSSLRADIPAGLLDAGDRALLEIWSQTQPIAWSALEDHAPLGIGVIGVRALNAEDALARGQHPQTFDGRLDVVSPVTRFVVQPAQPSSIDIAIANTGSAAWPTIGDLGAVRGAVRIALRWYDASGRIVGDNRWDMAVSLLPGDTTRVRATLSPTALNGQPLPPGRYEVRIGLFREGFEPFALDATRIPVIVD